MQKAGFKILKAWDFDRFAVQTYRENIGDHVEQADIKELHIEDIPKATAWAFGFPCQDLSVAGKQAGIKLECTDCGEVWEVDSKHYTGENACPKCGGGNYRAATRSGMFFEIMRLLQEAAEKEPDKLPKILIAENVKALGPYLPVLAAEYSRAGYKSYYQLFNSKWWGVPQNRERFIVVGIRDTLEGAYRYPAEQHEWIKGGGGGSGANFLVEKVPPPITEVCVNDRGFTEKDPQVSSVAPTLRAENHGNHPKIIEERLTEVCVDNRNFRKKAMENGYGASVGVAPALLSSDYNGPKVVIEERSTPPEALKEP